MDLKSRGQRGRSFIQRAIRRPDSGVPIVGSNATDHDEDDLTKKVEALFSQDLLFERLHTEPRFKKTYEKSVKAVKKSAAYVKRQKFATKAIALVVLSLSIGGVYQFTKPKKGTSGPAVTTVAGAQTGKSEPSKNGTALPKENPQFALLMPQGRKYDDVNVLRVSPAGNDPVYVFLDTLEGTQIKISQQKVPKTFDYNRAVELERVAKDFQATNVIQIDGDKVYHGLNEKTNTQSLLFIKKNLLVTISSSNKLEDDKWTGYILGLRMQ